MAKEFRLGDTDPRVGQAALSGGAGGVSPISPLTSVIRTSSQRPKFREAENIQGLPARQDPPGPGLGGGVGRPPGSAGNPIAGSIQEMGNKFARAIRGLPTTTELPTGIPGLTTSDIPSPTTSLPSPYSVVLPPAWGGSTADYTASLAMMNEGGFVRKRT